MKIALLLLAANLALVKLPVATQGQSYTASLGKDLAGCKVNNDDRTSPGALRGLPDGLSLSPEGKVSGTPNGRSAVYQFAVVCKDRGLIVEIGLKAK